MEPQWSLCPYRHRRTFQTCPGEYVAAESGGLLPRKSEAVNQVYVYGASQNDYCCSGGARGSMAHSATRTQRKALQQFLTKARLPEYREAFEKLVVSDNHDLAKQLCGTIMKHYEDECQRSLKK